MGYDTVANLISDAAIELGLISAPIVDPYASTDPNIVQLRQLLKSGGRDLAKRRNWSHLRKEYTFATVNGTEAYALPADFRCFIPNTGWDRTTARPLGGPVDGEYWQFTKAVPVAGTFIEYVRIWKGQFFVVPIPTAVETLAYEYQSTSWAGVAAAALPNGNTLDAPTDKAHVIFFDAPLVHRRLKLDWRAAKKFDTSEEQDAYDDALYAAELEDSPARTIYLGGRMSRSPRRIDRWNIPDTGAGQ